MNHSFFRRHQVATVDRSTSPFLATGTEDLDVQKAKHKDASLNQVAAPINSFLPTFLTADNRPYQAAKDRENLVHTLFIIMNKLTSMEDKLKHQAVLPGNSEASPHRKHQSVIRLGLVDDADVSNIPIKSHDIVEALASRGDEWDDLRGAKLDKRTLFLYPKKPEMETYLRDRLEGVRQQFHLSPQCRALPEIFMVNVLEHNFTKESLSDPKKHQDDWSKENGVSIIDVRWVSGQLRLSLATLRDAKTLCAGEVFLCKHPVIVE